MILIFGPGFSFDFLPFSGEKEMILEVPGGGGDIPLPLVLLCFFVFSLFLATSGFTAGSFCSGILSTERKSSLATSDCAFLSLL